MPLTITVAPWILVPLYPGYLRNQVRLAPNLVLFHGTVLGELAAQRGVFAPYGASHTDGTQLARCILELDCCTDGLGLITLASVVPNQGPAADETRDRIPVFVSGVFATGDLIGLDATAVAQLGRLLQGSVSQGCFWMP